MNICQFLAGLPSWPRIPIYLRLGAVESVEDFIRVLADEQA
jgi:hypothetical protein